MKEDLDALLGGLERPDEAASPTSAPPPEASGADVPIDDGDDAPATAADAPDSPSHAPEGAPAGGGREGSDGEPATAPVPPPIMRKRGGTGGYEGRTDFPDLFATDGTPLPAVRGSPEEKVEYFREKLRRAEVQLTRFREAWAVRESEMDAAEELLGREKARADETTSTLQKLQAFLEQKKLEIADYTKKVSGALAEREASLEKAKAEAEEARGRAEQARDDADDAQAEVERMSAELEHARTEAEQARSEAEEAQAEVDLARSEANDARAALERGQAEASDLRERIERQLEAKQAELARVVTVAKELQGAIQSRDAEIARLGAELEQASGASTAAKGELEARARAALADRDLAIDKLKGALADRDVAIEKLKAGVGSRNGALEKLEAAVRERDGLLTERDATVAKVTEGLRSAVARCKALEAELAQAHSSSPAVDAEGIRKALHVAGVLIHDLETAQAPRLGPDGRDTLGRLRRALEIAGELTRGGR